MPSRLIALAAPPSEPPDDRAAGHSDDLRRSTLARSGERAIPSSEDVELAALFLAGERQHAVAMMARIYGRAVGRLCFVLLGSQSEADESAQETMLAAFHAASSYRAEGSVRAWILGIARRVCAQKILVRARQARRRALLVDEASPADPSELHDAVESEASLRAALDTLTPGDREILALRFEAEQSFREIGDALGVDEAAARKRVGRALSKLREKVSR